MPHPNRGYVTVDSEMRLPEVVQSQITEAVIVDPRLADAVAPAVQTYFNQNPLTGATTEYVDQAITSHIEAPAPHPAYDNMPSLLLIFENKLI